MRRFEEGEIMVGGGEVDERIIGRSDEVEKRKGMRRGTLTGNGRRY